MRKSSKSTYIKISSYIPPVRSKKQDVTFSEELECLISDFIYLRSIICKTNHDFVFGVAFNSASFSACKLEMLFPAFEKQLNETKKSSEIVADYTTLLNHLKEEYNLDEEESGYTDTFLKTINTTIKLSQRLKNSIQ